MKKIFISSLVVAFLLVSLTSVAVLGAEKDNWVNVGAGEEGFTAQDGIITITSTGGYDANNNGVLYSKPLNLNDGITLEFTIDQFPAAGNAWWGPFIMNKPAYFNVADASVGEGFVFLGWPTGVVQVYGISEDADTVFQLLYQFALPYSDPADFIGMPMEFTMKTDDEIGLRVWVDGIEIEAPEGVNAENYTDLFAGDDAYIGFSTSDLGETEQISHILRLNGELPAMETTQEEDTAPETSDSSLIVFTLMIITSLSLIIVLIGKKSKVTTN